jgi:PAS domain S-box-containing protein
MSMQAEEQTIQTGIPVEAPARGRFLRLTISRKFLLVFAALAVVGLSNWLAIDSTLSQLRGATTLVNVIGSIRWTSQRIQLDIIRTAEGKDGRASVEEGLARLDEVIRTLSGGGTVLGFEVRELPEALRPSIEPLRLILHDYRADVNAALDDIRAGRDPDRALDKLFERGNEMQNRADALAAALSRQIAAFESSAAFGLYLLAFLDLAILAAALLAIRVQIVQPLQKLMLASQRFARGDYATRTQLDSADEIGDLARTFDRMAGDIQRDMSRIAGNMQGLEKSQALLRKVLETLPVGVWVTDGNGQVIVENPAGQRIWAGADRTGALRRGKYRGWWADSGKRIERGEWALERAISRGETSIGEAINIQCFDGSFKTILNSAAPLVGPQGEIEGAIVVNEDITERQRAAEELRVSKELFQTTFDSAAVGITLYDLSGRFLLANSALCETLGYGEEHLLRKSLREIAHPDDLARAAEFERQVLAGQLKRYGVEMRLFHRKGHVVWGVLSVALVQDREQAPLYFIGQILDISARKAMEQELIESRGRLRELAAHHDAVREEERKRIALEIHDELGQLLTALKMDISLLRMQFGADAELGRRTGDMRELVEKTIGVVRQVASNLRPAALNLGIVAALEWLVEDFGQRTGIAYELNLSGGEIHLDDTRATAVFRIVQESLTNVMRHAGAASVAVSLKRDGDALLLEVRDDGRGFDQDAVRHGPSFGLLGIRERVRVLGGSLSIEAAVGKGTMVSIHIPHASDERT